MLLATCRRRERRPTGSGLTRIAKPCASLPGRHDVRHVQGECCGLVEPDICRRVQHSVGCHNVPNMNRKGENENVSGLLNVTHLVGS